MACMHTLVFIGGHANVERQLSPRGVFGTIGTLLAWST